MKRVVITGMGVISPIANNVTDFWQALTQRVCGIAPITAFPTDCLPCTLAGEVKGFNPDHYGIAKDMARRCDRYALFALAAAHQAMTMSRLTVAPERLGVYIGSGIGGIQTFAREHTKMIEHGPRYVSPLFIPMMISNIAAGNVAITYNAQGPCLPTVTACATSSHAIGEAYRAIHYGHADAIIAGGAEAAITPIAVAGFANSKALSRSDDPTAASLPFDARRQGFVMGEGAGVVVLEALEHALQRDATIYGEVCGYGNTCDAFHYTAPRADAASSARCIALALQEADYHSGERLYVNAHGTGTPLNDKCETLALKKALGEEVAHKALISSNKSMLGHLLGAAGGVELIATCLTLNNALVPPTINLRQPDADCDLDYVACEVREATLDLAISNSFGFGGQNACIALRPFKL